MAVVLTREERHLEFAVRRVLSTDKESKAESADCESPGRSVVAAPHLLRMLVEPALNGFENVLMFLSGDPSFLAGGASGLDCTALADVGPVAA
jgi:hypothetical protein